jgi:hypothetical protein
MAAKTRILHLTLNRDPFDRIAIGKKKTEFREPKPYWKRRLEGRKYDIVVFRNGYAKSAPELVVEYLGLRRPKSSRSGDYEIRLGRVLQKKRWRGPAKDAH